MSNGLALKINGNPRDKISQMAFCRFIRVAVSSSYFCHSSFLLLHHPSSMAGRKMKLTIIFFFRFILLLTLFTPPPPLPYLCHQYMATRWQMTFRDLIDFSLHGYHPADSDITLFQLHHPFVVARASYEIKCDRWHLTSSFAPQQLHPSFSTLPSLLLHFLPRNSFILVLLLFPVSCHIFYATLFSCRSLLLPLPVISGSPGDEMCHFVGSLTLHWFTHYHSS